MNAINWYYSEGHETYGPFTAEQIAGLIQSGLLTRDHLVVPEGSEQWESVGASVFAGFLPQPARQAPAPPQRAPVAGPRFHQAGAPLPRRQAAIPTQAYRTKPKKTSILPALSIIVALAVAAGGAIVVLRPKPVENTKPGVKDDNPFEQVPLHTAAQSTASQSQTTTAPPSSITPPRPQSRPRAAYASPRSTASARRPQQPPVRSGIAAPVEPRIALKEELRIPVMQFTNATVGEAVELLRVQAKRLDPQPDTVKIILDADLDAKSAHLNLDAKDMPLPAALQMVAWRAGARLAVTDGEFHLQARR